VAATAEWAGRCAESRDQASQSDDHLEREITPCSG
jgi:hypothetical protein